MFLEGKTLELLIAAIVALVVVGPKDLPVLLRKFGQFMARLRGMAAEFRASFDEMARQSELDELRKEVDALRKGQLADQAASAAGLSEATNAIADDIHQSLSDVGVNLHPTFDYAAEAAPPPVTVAVEAKPKRTAKPRAQTAPKAAPKTVPARKAAAKVPAKAAVKHAPKTPAARKAPAKKAPAKRAKP